MNDEIENAALTDENSEALTPAEKEALLIRQNALMYNFMEPHSGYVHRGVRIGKGRKARILVLPLRRVEPRKVLYGMRNEEARHLMTAKGL